ncbi:histidinol-phosphate transaminase [Flavobacterium sp. DG1-102-2]|uniref:histidinol-phosphate transaminase n=1 Tax=Flavobacterium sp. DG1-102-2 TaxID=3081663 RepID=UPI002948E87C|nr:histidinol-phosphate transaminase [Flavobacterium sp. DG1-102-2]MDV6170352.1 histidinol-phosphate transaminase [Flavobacterium sp. DG1-102-2]
MFNLNTLVRPNILALEAYSSARDEFSGSEGIFLDANENPFGNLNRYPDPLQKELKQKLSAIKSVDTGNIFTGNGSDEAIDLCFRIFCKPGKDKALIFTPTYGMYEVSANVNNIELIKVELDSNFQIDSDTAKDALEDNMIKLIFICSPNNPTGNTINNVEDIVKSFNGIVVVDEAYADFSNTSLIDKIDVYPNLIILQTLSKSWGLAAARIGIAFASADIIKLFNKVKPPYNISRLNYTAAVDALDKLEIYKLQKSTIISEREKLTAALANLPMVKKVYPSQANFLLIQVTDADKIYNALAAKNIIIRNRNKVVNNCLRISVGTPQENQELVAALKTIES